MKNLLSIIFVISLSLSAIVTAQESDNAEAPEVSTVQELLMLVKEGKTCLLYTSPSPRDS